MEQNRLSSVSVSEQRWTLVRYRLRHFRYRTCIVQLMFLLLLLYINIFTIYFWKQNFRQVNSHSLE